jgi:hypothetical protein
LKRSSAYGSRHFNQRAWPVARATVSNHGQTVQLEIPGIEPTWGMEIRYQLADSQGNRFNGRIHNTIHQLPRPLP